LHDAAASDLPEPSEEGVGGSTSVARKVRRRAGVSGAATSLEADLDRMWDGPSRTRCACCQGSRSPIIAESGVMSNMSSRTGLCTAVDRNGRRGPVDRVARVPSRRVSNRRASGLTVPSPQAVNCSARRFPGWIPAPSWRRQACARRHDSGCQGARMSTPSPGEEYPPAQVDRRVPSSVGTFARSRSSSVWLSPSRLRPQRSGRGGPIMRRRPLRRRHLTH
jgi:hypothetical protein